MIDDWSTLFGQRSSFQSKEKMTDHDWLPVTGTLTLGVSLHKMIQARPNTTNESSSTDSLVTFYVCFPEILVRRVRANPASRCSILCNLCPARRDRFIFNGEVLNLDSTLGSYGIRNFDTIVGVPEPDAQGNLPTKVDYWRNVTKTSDSFGEFVKDLMTPSVRKESLRMRDLAMMKVESNPMRYRKMKQRYQGRPDQQSAGIVGESVVTANALQLSTEPLPILW
jgi:hypothetical protein